MGYFCLALPGCCKAKQVRLLDHLCITERLHCETAISRQGVNEWMDAHRSIALTLSDVCKAVGRSTKVAADIPPPQVTKMHSGKS